jgi:hypothetical protein
MAQVFLRRELDIGRAAPGTAALRLFLNSDQERFYPRQTLLGQHRPVRIAVAEEMRHPGKQFSGDVKPELARIETCRPGTVSRQQRLPDAIALRRCQPSANHIALHVREECAQVRERIAAPGFVEIEQRQGSPAEQNLVGVEVAVNHRLPLRQSANVPCEPLRNVSHPLRGFWQKEREPMAQRQQ